MNHGEVYAKLVARAKVRALTREDCYIERHHVVPRSEGGSDEADNIVSLTAREHYVAHLLLAKIYDDQPMHAAVVLMNGTDKHHKGHGFRFSSRLYEAMKVEFGRKQSKAMKGRQAGAANPMYGKSIFDFMTPEKIEAWKANHARLAEARKGYRHLAETRRKMSRSMMGNTNTAGYHWFNDG